MVKTIKSIFRKLYYLRSFIRFKLVGNNIILSKGGSFIRANEISLGSNIFINRNFHISARSLIIKDNVMIGPNLVIECDNHIFNKVGSIIFESSEMRDVKGVTIENDVWIGANVTILSGAYIGEGSVIGACSLVNSFIPPYTIAFGTPAKIYKTRFSKDELKEHLLLVKSNLKYKEILSIWQNHKVI